MAGAVSQIGSMIRQFFRWWLGELAALARPLTARAGAPRVPEQAILDLSGAQAVLWRCRNGTCSEAGRWEGARLGAAGLAKRSGGKRGERVLRLPGDKALRKSLNLPAEAENELGAVLIHQVDQHTPFSADEVALGWRVLERDPAARRISVEMTVVPRQLVDDAVARARGWGFDPAIVDVAGDGPPAPATINLLRRKPDEAAGGGWRGVNRLLGVIAAGLAVAAVAIPLDERRDRAEALAAELKALSARSREVLALRDRVDQLSGRARFLAGKRTATPLAITVVNELTRLIPADSWIYELRIDGRDVSISGYSPSAANLIGRIDASPLFGAPRFRSSITRAGDGDLERFNLTFAITQGEGGPGK